MINLVVVGAEFFLLGVVHPGLNAWGVLTGLTITNSRFSCPKFGRSVADEFETTLTQKIAKGVETPVIEVFHKTVKSLTNFPWLK